MQEHTRLSNNDAVTNMYVICKDNTKFFNNYLFIFLDLDLN